MCVVVDMNILPVVFDSSKVNHELYKPVFDWVINGKGKLVCGGSKYWEELKRLHKYVKVFNQLNKAGKLVKIPDENVDAKMVELEGLCDDADFDDPHIVALLIVSGCKVVTSEDERSYPYIKRNEWYPVGGNVPKIYKSSAFSRASSILSDANMAEVCKPCQRLNKAEARALADRVG